MATQLQLRRGTTSENASFTGAVGEVTVDTTKDTLIVQDGSTAGGFELARADGSNFVATSVDINGGTIDGTTIGASSASTGAFTTLTASGEITANGGIALGDNDKATFGAGDDLQIYHDGSNSYVSDTGTGGLYLKGSNEIALRNASNENIFLGLTDGSAYVYHNGSVKLATTNTGIDVTGTATMDGLTVDGSSKFSGSVDESSSGGLSLKLGLIDASISNSTDAFVGVHDTGGLGGLAGDLLLVPRSSTGVDNSIRLFSGQTTPKLRQNIAGNGDISFYEDTGTTPKFFWDASAESLGIGTSSPTAKLDVDGQGCFKKNYSYASTNYHIKLKTAQGSGISSYIGNVASNDRMNISVGGYYYGASLYQLTDGATGMGTINIGEDGTLTYQSTTGATANSTVNPPERMRIDSSGNLLVGKTSSDLGVTKGFEYYVGNGDSVAFLTRSNNPSAIFNRLGSDGTIAQFRKGGTTVGSIGVSSSNNLTVGSSASGHVGFELGNQYLPLNGGSASNGELDLGSGTRRFKDLYLSGGVYLGGTGAANKLDDYEEGTWTPTAQLYSGTMTVNSATYTKIGNLVTLKASVTFDATTDNSAVSIQNVPFAHTGANKANGGYVTASTVATASKISGVGSGTFNLKDASGSAVTYTAIAGSTLDFVLIYETA